MSTIRTCLQNAVKKLAEANVVTGGAENAALDASLLLCHTLGIGRTELYLRDDDALDTVDVATYDALIERRCLGEPVAYITGTKEFWGLNFDVEKGVLIPRPDTETLIATVMAHVSEKQASLSFVDVGVGSGTIILSLLHEFPNFKGEGVDISDTALKITQKNAEKFGVAERLTLHKGEFLAPIENTVDLIVSNPPYIEKDVISTLSVDVKGFEPMEALDGGADGLDCYRVIIPQACDKLNQGGLLIMEIGYDQAATVTALFDTEKWQGMNVIKDLAGHSRVVLAQKK